MNAETIAFTKPQVLIDLNKTYTDAFTNEKIRLYLPVDGLGNLTEAGKALRLECWETGGEVRKHLPEIFSSGNSGIGHALMRSIEEDVYCLLSRCVAFGTLRRMEEWLYTLTRCTEGDVMAFNVYYSR